MGEDKQTDYSEMILHFEKLRKDLHEDRLIQSQRMERTEEKIQNLESENIINHTFVHQVQSHMMDWERKIPELIHGAVKECVDFEIGQLKKDFNNHLMSTDPHPQIKKTRNQKNRDRLLLIAAFTGGSLTSIILKIILNMIGISI